jgi:D-3-phosphoglycerate dehydrogenase
MPTVLFSAPYMVPSVERFRPVLERYGITLIVANVQERLGEADILKYAGQFDGAICGDDYYTGAIAACAPALAISNGAPG